MSFPIKIPVKNIPDELSFVREIAKFHDPDFLEREDFDLVLKAYGIKNGDPLHLDFFVCGNILDSRFREPTTLKLSPENYNLFDSCVSSFHRLMATRDKGNQALVIFDNEDFLRFSDKRVNHLRKYIPAWINSSNKFAYNDEINHKVNTASLRIPNQLREYSKDYDIPLPLYKKPTGTIIVRDLRRSDLKDSQSINQDRKASFDYKKGVMHFGSEMMMTQGLGSSLAHEVHHLWLWLVCGVDNYQKIPPWFREGFAVVASDQLDEKRDSALSSRSVNEMSIDYYGLEDHVDDNYKYYPAGLSFQILVEKIGKNGVKKLILEIKEGKTFEEALKKVVPNFKDMKSFYKDLAHEVNRRVRKEVSTHEEKAYQGIITFNLKTQTSNPDLLKPDPIYPDYNPYKDYISMVLSVDKNTSKPALRDLASLCKRFLEKYPNSPYQTGVRCVLGVAYYYLGEISESKRELEFVVISSRKFDFWEYAYFYLEMTSIISSDQKRSKLVELGDKLTIEFLRNQTNIKIND